MSICVSFRSNSFIGSRAIELTSPWSSLGDLAGLSPHNLETYYVSVPAYLCVKCGEDCCCIVTCRLGTDNHRDEQTLELTMLAVIFIS